LNQEDNTYKADCITMECSVCGCNFTYAVTNESFGITEGTDFKIYNLICPNLECKSPIILRHGLDYDRAFSKSTEKGGN